MASWAGANVRLTSSPRPIPETTIAPIMSPASTSAGRSGEEPDDEEQAADQLDHPDRVHKRVGRGQAVRLEGSEL